MMNKTDTRTTDEIIAGVIESLDTMLGRVERSDTLLNTARDLLVDYCYTNNTPYKDGEMEMPSEIDIAVQIINLVIRDMGTVSYIVADNNRDLGRISG